MDQNNYYRTEFEKFGLSKDTIAEIIDTCGIFLSHQMPDYWVRNNIVSSIDDPLPPLKIDSYLQFGFTEITALKIIKMINEEMTPELSSLHAKDWAIRWCQKCNKTFNML